MEVASELVEVILKQPDDFLKVMETLTRVGVPSETSKTLWQSCHILHKRGRYYIVHFKQLFKLDGRESEMDEDDYARLNTIVRLLSEWGLVVLPESSNNKIAFPQASMKSIKVIPFKDKGQWTLQPKYQIGRKTS
jgi:hypothetical protein